MSPTHPSPLQVSFIVMVNPRVLMAKLETLRCFAPVPRSEGLITGAGKA